MNVSQTKWETSPHLPAWPHWEKRSGNPIARRLLWLSLSGLTGAWQSRGTMGLSRCPGSHLVPPPTRAVLQGKSLSLLKVDFLDFLGGFGFFPSPPKLCHSCAWPGPEMPGGGTAAPGLHLPYALACFCLHRGPAERFSFALAPWNAAHASPDPGLVPKQTAPTDFFPDALAARVAEWGAQAEVRDSPSLAASLRDLWGCWGNWSCSGQASQHCCPPPQAWDGDDGGLTILVLGTWDALESPWCFQRATPVPGWAASRR